MKKNFYFLLSLLFVVAVLAGCSGAGDSTAEPADVSSEPAVEVEAEEPKSSDVTVGIAVAPGTFDPIGMANTTYNVFVTQQIFSALYGFDQDGNIVPKLAVSENMSEDGTTLTIKVRTDVKFHNGDLVTVDDIVYSYNTYMTSPNGTINLNYLGAEMTKIDEETVSIPLVYPRVNYKEILTVYSVVPKSVYEADPEAFAVNPIGSGPYQFVSFSGSELVELKSFENYFEGAPHIEKLYAKVIQDPSTAAIALESGELDVLFNVPALELDRLASNENLAINKTQSAGVISLGLMKGETMNNALVRQAIFHAVNPEDALIAARNGDGEVAVDLVPGNSIGSLAGVVKYGNTYDPELAKQLLEESGFDTTTPITFTLCPGYFGADASAAGLSIANNLEEIGLNIEMETLDPNVCTEKWLSGNVEMMINKQGGFIMNVTDALNWYTTAGDFFNMNNEAAKSAELDEQVMKARYALDDAVYQEAGEAMLNLFYETYQLLPLYVANENVVYNADLKNIIVDSSAYGYVNAFYWTY